MDELALNIINQCKFIEVNVEKHQYDDPYYKFYVAHIFFTVKKYSHSKLKEIMANTQQTYIYNDDIYCNEIDFQDLCKKLAEHDIYLLTPVERYYFDIEKED